MIPPAIIAATPTALANHTPLGSNFSTAITTGHCDHYRQVHHAQHKLNQHQRPAAGSAENSVVNADRKSAERALPPMMRSSGRRTEVKEQRVA